MKDSVHVSGNKDLNPSPEASRSEAVFLHVNSCIANVHSVTGLPQKKGVNPNYCYNHTEIKHVNDVSCVGHLSSANIATNIPTVVINPPVWARLHQFWEKWEALGSSPKVVTILRESYTLPFQFRPNLTRSPTVINTYVNPQRPLRSTAYETHTVALEEQLESTRITRKGDTLSQAAPPPLKVVAGGKQCSSRSTITPTETCSADLYRCIKRRVGRSLKRTHCKGNLVTSRKLATHKLSGNKGGLCGPKRVPRPLREQHSSYSYRQHHSGCLHKQRRGF